MCAHCIGGHECGQEAGPVGPGTFTFPHNPVCVPTVVALRKAFCDPVFDTVSRSTSQETHIETLRLTNFRILQVRFPRS